jgi:peptidoglycan hydrolase-like protein with peptidoglycan-binding domain
VVTLQQELAALTYQPGRTDGVFDDETRQAVVAFQKVEGLSRDGVVGPTTWAELLTAQAPSVRLAAAGTRVEIDLTRQVLLFIKDNQVVKTLAVSTGKPGWRTPPGHFSVYRKIPAWHRSALGLLYKPSYIVRGIAIHGSTSVPAYPASHGCIRVTVAEMDVLYPELPLGLTVDVYY